MDSHAETALRMLLGLDKQQSLWQQYLDYWQLILHGNLGRSFTFFPTPVAEIVKQALPWTIGLVGVATIIAFTLGTLVGRSIGWRRGTWADSALPISAFFSAVPVLLARADRHLGLLGPARLVPLERQLRPLDGAQLVVRVHRVRHLLRLPAGDDDRRRVGVRVDPRDAQHDGHRVLRGLRDGRAGQGPQGAPGEERVRRRATRSSRRCPASRCRSGFVVGGTLIMEMVFSYQGIGYVLFTAVSTHDYPLMQGCFLVITLAVLVANIVADFVYAALDPRTRQEG